MRNAITGANEADKHYVGVNLGRDYQIAENRFADLRNAGAGDPCPRCGTARWSCKQAIEVGHVFKLGTKYSEALEAKFLDAHEQQHTIIMGCYGIGVNRIIAALVETSHDENGIIWPMSLAPYEVILIAAERQRGRSDAGGRAALRRTCRRPASTCCSTIATSGRASNSRTPT